VGAQALLEQASQSLGMSLAEWGQVTSLAPTSSLLEAALNGRVTGNYTGAHLLTPMGGDVASTSTVALVGGGGVSPNHPGSEVPGRIGSLQPASPFHSLAQLLAWDRVGPRLCTVRRNRTYSDGIPPHLPLCVLLCSRVPSFPLVSSCVPFLHEYASSHTQILKYTQKLKHTEAHTNTYTYTVRRWRTAALVPSCRSQESTRSAFGCGR
jgi:hypothetical protein